MCLENGVSGVLGAGVIKPVDKQPSKDHENVSVAKMTVLAKIKKAGAVNLKVAQVKHGYKEQIL